MTQGNEQPDTGPLPRQPLHIDEIFAFVAVNDEGEGIISFPGPVGWIPLVGADTARVNLLRTQAQIVADAENWEVRLVKFTNREELEVIRPSGNPVPVTENIAPTQPSNKESK